MQQSTPTAEQVAARLAGQGIAATAREVASVVKAMARLAPERRP